MNHGSAHTLKNSSLNFTPQTRSNYSAEFKREFSQTFIEMVEQRTGEANLSDAAAFQRFSSFTDKVKGNFFVDMGKLMHNSCRKLHDHFHNFYSRQFCCDFHPFKAEVIEMLKYFNGKAKNTTTMVIDMLRRRHPECRFHYQTVYQFINYQLKKTRKSAKDTKTLSDSCDERQDAAVPPADEPQIPSQLDPEPICIDYFELF